MEKIIAKNIKDWCERGQVMGLLESRKLAFEATATMLLGCHFSQAQMTSMMGNMDVMASNFFTLPIDLPGFGFHKVSCRLSTISMFQHNLSSADNCDWQIAVVQVLQFHITIYANYAFNLATRCLDQLYINFL